MNRRSVWHRLPKSALVEYLAGRLLDPRVLSYWRQIKDHGYFTGLNKGKVYKPNGKREVARRLRQIQNGQLTPVHSTVTLAGLKGKELAA